MKKCPRCFETYNEFHALSRKDNRTEICPRCGVEEALEDASLTPKWDGHVYWHTQEKSK